MARAFRPHPQKRRVQATKIHGPHPKCPTLYSVREADGLIELHVDDGTRVRERGNHRGTLGIFLSEKIEMKYVQWICCGSYECLQTMKVRDEKKLTNIPNKKYLHSAMTKMVMSDCKGSVSPKLQQGKHGW